MNVKAHLSVSNPLYRYLARAAKKIISIYIRTKKSRKARYIDKTVQVLGWRSVEIGKLAVISEGSWLNVNHRSRKSAQIVIEDNCFIGRRNFLSSGKLIRIGSYCLTGIDCKFMGSNHVYETPFRPYITTGTTGEAVINIGVNCWLGANVSIIGQSRIGHGSIIGANSLVKGDVPAFSVVVGNPARVIKRFDAVSERWVPAADFNAEMEARLPSEGDYLRALRASAPHIEMPILGASGRLGDLP